MYPQGHFIMKRTAWALRYYFYFLNNPYQVILSESEITILGPQYKVMVVVV